MKKLLFILILCQITIASDWKKVPVSTKNPVLSINKTFVESRRCFGACCNEEYESECITAGNPKQSISVVLDFKHNLARNNSPYKIEIVFYDRNDFKLEDRYVFAWENGHYEFNGWWTKRGYEVGESVVKYAMIRIVPSQSYHIRPKNTWLDDNYGGIIRCGGVWKNGLCEEKPRCGEAVRAGYLSHRDTSRYDSTTNTCMKLPNGARWKNNNTYTYKSFEQSYHYIGKHYFQLCSYDYNRGSFFGNQSLVYCFMYDIQNLKKPTLLKENGIFDFLNEKQKNKLIDLIIKNNPDKFQQQTDMISDIANIIIENQSNKNNYLLKINYYAYYGQLRYVEFNIPEEILRTIIPKKFFPNLS